MPLPELILEKHSGSGISTLLALTQDLIRDALAALLTGSGKFRVVAACPDGVQAWQRLRECKPELAVIDLDLGGLEALELIGRIRDHGLPTRALVLTDRQDRKSVLEALRAGASGYVLRSGSSRYLFEALDHARRGGIYLSPVLDPEKVFGLLGGPEVADPLRLLSTREYQVFTLLVEGVRAKEIASRLDLSPKTVDSHRASLMRKLDIFDVAGLVKFAVKRNLTTHR